MTLQASFHKQVFRFNFKARTSRGVMKDKASWFIKIYSDRHPENFGLGECGPLPGLSVDDRPDFEQILAGIIEQVNAAGIDESDAGKVKAFIPAGFPSVRFGLETALLDFQNGCRRIVYRNRFLQGDAIAINGLIWMGDMDFMMEQINQKIAQGFSCLKLKVGGLDFDRECDILSYIRKKYFRHNIIIRLDANGALKLDEVLYKLDEMAKFRIHSIEQPIRPGLHEMEELCRKSPIPVAFDEELIGLESVDDKRALLVKLKPRFIVLKPTLHGGLEGCKEWITVAEGLQTGWWITSALESSVGLNAICQFTANYETTIHQGLGTGMIYENNIRSPLTVKEGKIYYDQSASWDEAS